MVKGLWTGPALRWNGGRQIVLPARAVVGRSADCDVVLEDDSVSRRHAALFRDQRGLYRLEDLKSRNGTFLNGKRLEGEGSQPIPEGARLRFGEIELTFRRAGAGMLPRKMLLPGALLALIAGLAALLLLRRAGERTATPGSGAGQNATALLEQAQAAIAGDRFGEAAALAQRAIDKDPLGPAQRKLLLQARREQQAATVFADASAKAQAGHEDEALRRLTQVSPQSRFFPRARIKAKDLASDILRTHGQACRTAPRANAVEVAEECARALDVRCQQGAVDRDPMLKALRAAENRLPRHVSWTCPTSLAPLFHEERVVDGPSDETLAALYTDAGVREAMQTYARGDVNSALRTLARLRGPATGQAQKLTERLKLVDGRFREGQTALWSNLPGRADELWGAALAEDGALMPAGVESFLGRQMRTALARAHGKNGDDRFAREQYASACDEWRKGLAVAPRDPHLLDSLARLERVAEGLLAPGAGCDQARVAAHITQADPPSPAHEAAQEVLEGCR